MIFTIILAVESSILRTASLKIIVLHCIEFDCLKVRVYLCFGLLQIVSVVVAMLAVDISSDGS